MVMVGYAELLISEREIGLAAKRYPEKSDAEPVELSNKFVFVTGIQTPSQKHSASKDRAPDPNISVKVSCHRKISQPSIKTSPSLFALTKIFPSPDQERQKFEKTSAFCIQLSELKIGAEAHSRGALRAPLRS
ncbi:MAG: hypothetical protein QNJ51_30420 [Calothrix sp. MO_167.B12]|nr:hypothetical protein [Calothrix sp. MO_167.B12]